MTAPIHDQPTRTPDADFLLNLDGPRGDSDHLTPETLMPRSGPPAIDRRQVGFEVVPGYEVLQELGRGGMGVVYKARQVGLDRVVALKMILAGVHASDDERGRFRREAEAIARLAHPNIVQVYEVSEHNGQPYFSLEFCGGGTLLDLLTGTPMLPTESARLLVPLARAVQHAHEHGVVHRDLKPGNVLLSPVGQAGSLSLMKRDKQGCLSYEPKITDFGLAKRLDLDTRTRDGDVMGTPSYMAPEQAAGKVLQMGPHSDTYALGAILYECLTGRPPFRASSPMETVFQVITRDPVPIRDLQPKVPRDLETICLKCLRKEPAKRYASAGELADDLERFLEGRPIFARPVGPTERAWRWVCRHPAYAALSVVMAGVLFAGASGWVWFTQQLQAEKTTARHEAEEADYQRGVAEQKRREAEANERLAVANEQLAEARFLKALEVADHYFTEVSESTLLHEPGMETLRRKLLARARDFYTGFVRERNNDERLAGELARSVYRLALIEAELGDLAGGVAQLRDALARFDRLLAGRASDGRLQEIRARLLNDLGRLERHRDRPEQATEAYTHALAAWEHLDHDTAGSLTAREGLARCLLGLGNVELSQQRRRGALEHYLRALDIRRSLAGAEPGNETYQRDVAITWQNLALIHTQLNQTKEAVEANEQARKVFRQLVQAHPSRARFREDLGIGCYNEGYRRMRDREFDTAADTYREAVACFEFLVFTHPGVPGYLNRLGHSLYNLGLSLEHDDLPDEADVAFARARQVRRDLATAKPNVPEYQVAYAQCLRRDGDRAAERMETKAAVEAYRQARRVLEKAPVSPTGRLLLAELLLELGRLEPNRDSSLALLDESLVEARALIRQKQFVEPATKIETEALAERSTRAKSNK